jgi:hypothetical protein
VNRSLICAAFCIGLLSGCATGPTGTSQSVTSITPDQVYQLQASYVLARTGLVAYRQLPWCPAKPVCQDKTVARQMQKADAVAMATIEPLVKRARAGETIDLKSFDSAQIAVNLVSNLDIQYRSP